MNFGKSSATCRGCAASAWDELRKPRNLGPLALLSLPVLMLFADFEVFDAQIIQPGAAFDDGFGAFSF
jgi:hypothetical protein